MGLEGFCHRINKIRKEKRSGKVNNCIGLVIEASCPGAFVGELCEINPRRNLEGILAEVVGFKGEQALLMPYGKLTGVTHGCDVRCTGEVAKTQVSNQMLGRVLDAFANPIDGGEALCDVEYVPIYAEPRNPMEREPVQQVIETGIKSIDSLLTLGMGQRVGLFAGSGVGKSTLLSQVCTQVSADINVVALIGERGREVEEFVNQTLGDEGLKKSVVIAATAEQPPLVRAHAAYTAIAIAEHFAAKGKNVLLTMDSVTRFAMALREVGLAIGEPPTVKGYTPSVFSALPGIVERCGNYLKQGSITAILSVLVESDDFNDPIFDALRAILDGHIVLSRDYAEKGHFPAIDPLKSTSRLFNQLVSSEHKVCSRTLKGFMSDYHQNSDMLELDLFDGGDRVKRQRIVKRWQTIAGFLQQDGSETFTFGDTLLLMQKAMEECNGSN